jgi:membrane protease YdiL (CAAX protease family)
LLAAAYAVAGMRARRRVIGNPESLVRLRSRLGSVSSLLPRTPGERLGFAGLSLTAGICEEILYRGYLPWYLGAWTTPWLAIGASCVLFGFAHVYLGSSHILRTAIVGAVLALVVALSGSLIPAMFIHATMDLLAGVLGFRSFGVDRAPAAPAAPAAPTATGRSS